MASSRDPAHAVMRLSPADNVAVALRHLKAGEMVVLDGVPFLLTHAVAVGQKFAARPIERGEIVVKYGCPIGTATAAIALGEPVHAHNVESDYLPTDTLRK